jgi:hypothetical protein
VGVGLGLKRGPGGGGGNCLSFCARAGGLKKIAAPKNKASADRTSAGGKNFPYLIKSIEPTPHAASSLLAIALTPTDGMIVGALAQIKITPCFENASYQLARQLLS